MKLAWSELAIAELAEIRSYSVRQWGRRVAAIYVAELAAAARDAAARPHLLRPLREPFRIRRVGSHYLLAHCDEAADRLTIARVLHVRMDLERHLQFDPPGK